MNTLNQIIHIRRKKGLLFYIAILAMVAGMIPPQPVSAVAPNAPQMQTLFAASINFQDDADTTPPAGYLEDFGEAYGARTGANQGSGLSYGWIDINSGSPVSLVGQGRDRSSTGQSNLLLATTIHMNHPSTPPSGYWEIAVPNGTYSVTASVGDASGGGNDPETHRINAEGISIINNYVPSGGAGSNTRHTTGSGTITVSDGKLTLDYSGGGVNTKLNYVEIQQQPDAPTQFPLQINFNAEAGEQPAGYLLDFGQAYSVRNRADQGDSAYTYGWVNANDGATPLDLSAGSSGNGRDRGTSQPDQRLDSLMHMQADDLPGNFSGVKTEGIWEIALPNGLYEVTVAAGDPNVNANDPEVHALNVEGAEAIFGFAPSGPAGSAGHHQAATLRVGVTDGKLSIDAKGGLNTKINYVDIDTVAEDLPYVTSINPPNRSTDVERLIGLGADINVPGAGCGVDPSSLDDNVFLYAVNPDGSNGALVPSSSNTSGGNDTINLAPDQALAENTQYRFVIDGVKSELNGSCPDGGDTFPVFQSLFSTGTELGGGGGGSGTFDPINEPGDPQVSFEVVDLGINGIFFTSVEMGPDGKLYGASNNGQIHRYTVNADGTLSNGEILKGVAGDANPGFPSNARLLIGLTFDPDSTASNPVAWATHTVYGFDGIGDRWGGKISRLSGPNLENVQDVFVNLPRSAKDHVTNSIDYGPDGRLYLSQGSNLAAGVADNSWGTRPETLLTAAVLVFDDNDSAVQNAISSDTPIDVKTSEAWPGGNGDTSVGTYNPYAINAPLKVFATGIRNAYDLVWHSNGYLYVPTNGTAGGGESPDFPVSGTDYSYCSTVRPDGRSASELPSVDGINNNSGATGTQGTHEKQRDFMFIVDGNGGGYFGHPNPARCEWVLNIGNPTSDKNEPGEGQGGSKYPVGTSPDPNYRGYPNFPLNEQVYDFDFNKSPNGVIEYLGNNFQGELQNRLLVVRFSNNNDLFTIQVDDDGSVLGAQPGVDVPGFGNAPGEPYNDPLEVAQNVATGDLYLAQYDRGTPVNGAQKLFLLRPADRNVSDQPDIAVAPTGLVFDQVTDAGQSATQMVTVSNNGSGDLTLSEVSLIGANADEFVLVNDPTDGTVVPAGGSIDIDVAFDPSSNGPKEAALRIASNDADTPLVDVELDGLGKQGLGGANEPSLQWILDTLDIPVNVGDNDPGTNKMGATDDAATAPLLGDEIAAQLFQKVGTGTVDIDLLAVFGPTQNNPVTAFGWYAPSDSVNPNELFTVSNSPASNGQRLLPPLNGTTSFNPGSGSFGIYSRWPFFGDRLVYSQDDLNTFEGNASRQHKVRVYELKDESGTVVPNAYVVATEETTSGFDYQDIVVILRNVRPAQLNGDIATSPAELIYSGVKNTTTAAVSTPDVVTITNAGVDPLTINGATFAGANPGAFALNNPPSFPVTLNQGEQLLLAPQFTPGNNPSGSTGAADLSAVLQINSDDADAPTVEVGLFGLSASGLQGNKEPTLQQVLNTLGYGIDAGFTTLTSNTSNFPIGDETLTSLFQKAGPGDVGMTVVARYSPDELLPYGYYIPDGTQTPPLSQVAVIDTDGNGNNISWEQTLFPQIQAGGATTFDPGNNSFGLYVDSNTFNRTSYTQDDLNTGIPHATRIYPLKDRAGNPVPNAYIIGYEDASNGDYQDYVFVLTNVEPATNATPICDPISTLECDDVPVVLPYSLSFTSDQGGLASGNGIGTGFTMVDPPSARLTADNPVFNDNVPGYEPSKLTINTSAGTLSIASTKGIQYAQPASQGEPSSTDTNSQINALGVGFDASSQKLRIETTIVNPPAFPTNNQSQQAGLYFGLNEDNYVKIVYGNAGNGNAKVQMLLETDASGTLDYEGTDVDLNTDNFSQSGINSVTLALEIDPATGEAQAFYATNGGAETLVAQNGNDSVSLPASFFAGVNHDQAGATDPISYAGVFTTNRRASGSLTFAFSDFSIAPAAADAEAPTVTIDVSGTQNGDGDYLGSATVAVNASDAGGSGVASTEYSLDGGTTFQPYTGTLTFSDEGSYTVDARATDGAGNVGNATPVSFDVIDVSSGDIALTNRDWQFPSGVTEAGRAHFDSWMGFNRHQNNRTAADANYGQHDSATLRVTNASTDEELQIFSFNLVGNTSGASGNPAFALPNGEETLADPIVLQPGGFYDVVINFIYSRATNTQNENVFAQLEVESSDSDTPTASIGLGGTWQRQREGGNEPNVAEIVEAFGFQTTIANPGQPINNKGVIEAIGEEVLTPFWTRADDTQPVYVRQLAAFHSCCPNVATFKIQPNISSDNTNNVLTHNGDDGQSYLPRKGSGIGQSTVTPSNQYFGFKIDPENSDWDLNTQPTATDEGHHFRAWPARDVNGELIPNAYLMVMDYAGINYDFNDNVYYVTNVAPAPNTVWRDKIPVDISVTLEASDDPAAVGESLTYTATVINNRDFFTAYEVLVEDDLPANTTFVDASDGCTESGGTVSCTIDVGPAASSTVTITVEPQQEGSLENTVDASVFGLVVVPGSSTNPGTVSDQASVTVQVADPANLPGTITIIKEASPESAQPFDFTGDLGPFTLVDDGSTGAEFNYNMQPAAAPVPAGYEVDSGAAYGARSNGQTYGWLKTADDQPIDASVAMRDRNRSGIPQELDTFQHMQRGDCCDTGFMDEIYWQHELPAGRYEVKIVAGDQPAGDGEYDSQHQYNIEGAIVPATPYQPTTSQEYLELTVTVDVTDGALTIEPTDAAFNTKLNYVEITAVQPNAQLFTNVSPGTYGVTEVVPSDWALTDIVCDDGDSTGDVGNATATINLSGSEDVTCTFSNQTAGVQTATLNGTATRQGRSDNSALLTVELFDDQGTLVTTYNDVVSDASGAFSISGIDAGAYQIGVKANTNLRVMESATLVAGEAAGVDFGEMPSGDINNDNEVDLFDLSLLSNSYDQSAGDADYNENADLNGNSSVDLFDLSLLSNNYDQSGEGPATP